jgi:hypothetical protein
VTRANAASYNDCMLAAMRHQCRPHLAGELSKDHQAGCGEVEAGAGGCDAEQGNTQRRLIPEALDHLRGSVLNSAILRQHGIHT